MNDQQASPLKDMMKGAFVGAVVVTVIAVLANKDTRDKIAKGVKDAISEMQKRADDISREAKDKYEKTIKSGEDSGANR